ncbi:TetR/AcrR family transcriptional regulator [Phytoactinopolyspora endophytica]|uniref:TetR/AcrR family transcriptional regulator n=1 Tax=Phytoactinopolyspora endophytica TaxID=1642495 RepID=UPI00101C3BA7|nr:TetR/AcrR family transcriptional regulator [Phytoactinopolyspora endophytica]
MQHGPAAKPARRPRADGERNRARLVTAAKRAMTELGATVSLEQVAREAGVSIATLYRHFPTRETLIEAVYRQETDSLVDAAAQLTEEREPIAALREWLLLFVDFLDTKQGLSEVLGTLIGGPDGLYSDSSVRLASAVDALVSRATETGPLRADIEPLDLLRALGGVANVSPDKNWKRSAIRMVDLLLKGLQDDADIQT